MKEGCFRDGFPRLTIELPGRSGSFSVEFIVDTGFDGGLTLPEHLARDLDTGEPEVRFIRLAGGFQQQSRYYEILLENEDGEEQDVEALVLEGNPLMGNTFLAEMLLSIETTEGGEVAAEAL